MRFLSKIRGTLLAALILVVVGTALAKRPALPSPAVVRPPGQFLPGAAGGPMTPWPNPAQVRAEMRNLLATQPHEVFARLNNERGQVFTPDERVDLARQTVARLATRVAVADNRWVTLTELRTACRNAELFDPAVRKDLDVLARLAERRALTDALFEVRHLEERGPRSEAVQRGQEWLKRIRGLDRWGLDKQTVKTRGDVTEAIAGIVRIDLEREAIEALLQGLPVGSLDKIQVANLPPRLHDSVQALRGLKTVCELAAESRLDARDVVTLKDSLDLFTKGLRTLPDADAALGTRILQDLAVRHVLEGHAYEYRALMPRDGPADRAAELLRDMKALALGEGEVVTAPARQALTDKAGDIPTGIRPLLPESARKNWHPPMTRNSKAPPSPLEKAARAGEELRTRIETDLKSERITQAERAKESQGRLAKAQHRLQEQEEADGKRLAELIADLKKQNGPNADAKAPRK